MCVYVFARAGVFSGSGTTVEMVCFDILKVYMRLVKESPLARYLSVIANLMSGVIAFLYFVFFLDIFGATIHKSISKSLVDIRRKLVKPAPSSLNSFRSKLP